MKPADKAPGSGGPRKGDGRPKRRCPVCGKPAQPDFRPFCSKRCADIDLGRWLGGRYMIAGARPGEDEQD